MFLFAFLKFDDLNLHKLFNRHHLSICLCCYRLVYTYISPQFWSFFFFFLFNIHRNIAKVNCDATCYENVNETMYECMKMFLTVSYYLMYFYFFSEKQLQQEDITVTSYDIFIVVGMYLLKDMLCDNITTIATTNFCT